MRDHKKGLLAMSICALAIAVAACSSGNAPQSSTPSTGQLVDSAVQGVSYKTATQSGVTDSEGNYKYLPGETVTFSIGDIVFPAVKPDSSKKSIITPLELAGTTDVNSKVVQNIIRLLQTLDSNGNPDDGITILSNSVTTSSLDFNAEPADFEAEVKSEIGLTLISYEAALAHFEAELIRINYFGTSSEDLEEENTSGEETGTPVSGGVVESTTGDVHIKLNLTQLDGGISRLDVEAVDTPLVYGVDVSVGFDHEVITVIDQYESKAGVQSLAGDFFGDTFFYIYDYVSVTAQSGSFVRYAVSLLNPAVDVSNTGTLVTVFFKPNKDAETTITLVKADFGDSEGVLYKADPVSMSLTVTAAGSVTVNK